MSTQTQTSKNTSKQITAPKQGTAPAKPPVVPTGSGLAITDPNRKLSRDEWRALSTEEKAARKSARSATRGPAKQRYTAKVGNVIKRAERLLPVLVGTDAHKHISHAIVALKAGREEVADLPATWQPAGATTGAAPIEPGAMVNIRDTARAAYAGLLEPAEMVGLKVVKSLGSKLIATTAAGVRMVIARNRIERAAKA